MKYIYLALLCLLLTDLSAQTQTCSQAQTISDYPTDLFGATPAWYSFDVPFNGHFILSSCGYNAHPEIEVYLECEDGMASSPLSPMSMANCGAESCSTPQLLVYEVVGETRVYIAVTADLCGTRVDFDYEPSDPCIDKTLLSCGTTIESTTVGLENKLERTDYETGCPLIFNNDDYQGSDQVFELDLIKSDSVVFFMENVDADLDMFLFETLCEGDEISCLGLSTQSGTDDETIGPIFLEAGTYYIVVDGWNEAIEGTFSLNVTCLDVNCDCRPGNLICDNFDAYLGDSLSTQSPNWIIGDETNRDALVVNNTTTGGQNALFIEHSPITDPSNVALLLGNRNEGAYQLSWSMLIPEGANGNYSLMHNQFLNNFSHEVVFNANGVGQLRFRANPIFESFTFPVGEWFEVFQVIDLENNTINLSINGQFVKNWPFDLGYFENEPNNLNQLSALQFIATENARFYVDDICFSYFECVTDPVFQPVCANGKPFGNEQEAACYGIFDFTEGTCNPCDFAFDLCCNNPTNGSTTGDLNIFNQENLIDCSGLPIANASYNGRDRLYKIEITNCTTLFAEAEFPSASMDLFLLENCSLEENCVLAQALPNDNNLNHKTLSFQLCEGTYYLLVDGQESGDFGDFVITASYDCTPNCAIFDPIGLSCNSITNGSTMEEINCLDISTYSSCIESSSQYDGNDIVYSVQVNSGETLEIELTDLTADLDVFLLQPGGDELFNCQAASTNDGLSDELIQLQNAGGFYFIVVDGKNCELAGDFNLKINCNCFTDLTLISENQLTRLCENETTLLTATLSGTMLPDTLASYIFNWSTEFSDTTNSNSSQIEVGPGTYCVTATDGEGCIETDCWEIDSQPIPSISGVITHTTCNLNNGAIDVTVEGGTPPYTYDWNSGDDTEDVNNLTPGAFCITVSDGNSCEVVECFEINNSTSVDVIPLVSNASCEQDNGAIQLEASNGTPPYTFNFEGSDAPEMIDLAPGTYCYTVTDAIGCITTGCATVNNDNSPEIEFATTNELCGESNGAIAVNIIPGNPPYQFLWSTGDTTQSLENLIAGIYELTVTDALGCTTADTINLVGEDSPMVIIDEVFPTRCGLANGSIFASVTVGTPPYTFLWSNDSTTTNIQNLSDGQYTVTVADANNCMAIASATILPSEPLIGSIITQNAACNEANGQLELIMENGAVPYSYTWEDGSTEAIRNNLNVGIYNVTIMDANECILELSASIVNEGSPQVSISNVSNENCGRADGSLNLSVEDGTPPYTFFWSNGDSTQNISNLEAGDYIVTITDANNCVVIADTSVVENLPPDLSLAVTNATCNTENGSIDLSISNGATPYTILWSTNENSEDLTGIGNGEYSVTVTDGNNCEAITTVDVQDSGQPVINFASNPSTCRNDNGSINLDVSSGSGSYVYQWSNGENTEDLFNIGEGFYSVTVTDDAECSANVSIEVTNIAGPVAETLINNATCSNNNGSINLEISGGTPPFIFSWSNESNEQNITNLTAGEYSVTITDANNCIFSLTENVEDEAAPSPSFETSNETCSAANGAIELNLEGGTAPFNFLWSNGSTEQSQSNLVANIYEVTITDANGCEVTDQISIVNEATATLFADIINEACESGNGAITLTLEGGTPPFDYQWSNGSNTSAISNLEAGSYGIIITDANECTITQTFEVESEAGPVATVSSTPSVCGAEEGTVTLVIENGTPPFLFQWSNGATTQNLMDVPAGTYQVFITDANECSSTATAIVEDEGSTLVLNTTFLDNSGLGPNDGIVCAGDSVTVILEVSNGSGNYSIEWDNGFGQNQALSGIAMTTIDINFMVTDADNNCTSNTQTTVFVNDLPQVITNSNAPLCEGLTLELTAEGGQNYQWAGPDGFASNEQNPTIANFLPANAGDYSVTVTNENNCQANAGFNALIINAENFPPVAITNSSVACDSAFIPEISATIYPEINSFGMWFSEGSSGIIDNPEAATTTISNLEFGPNLFVWELSTEDCVIGIDSVIVQLEQAPFAQNDTIITGENVPIRNLDLVANDNVNAIQSWRIQIDDQARATVQNNGNGTVDIIPDETFFGELVFNYTLFSDNCEPPSTAQVVVQVEATQEAEFCIFDLQQSDVWTPCFFLPEQNEMVIMNRYGKVVFVAKDYSPENAWDGTLPAIDKAGLPAGKSLAPTGTYYFVLRDNKRQEEKGRVVGSILVLR